MSERNEPAADAAKPTDDRDEQARPNRSPSDAAKPTESRADQAKQGGSASDAAAASGDEQNAKRQDAQKPGEEKPGEEKPGAEKQDVDKPGEDTSDSVVDEDGEPDKALPAEEIRRYDCSVPEQRTAGLADAASAIRQGKLVVIPTDTVYGIGADAFTPSAVNALLAAKGRGRDMPVPVLVGTVRAATALIDDLGLYGQDLIDHFWPGPLTIICHAGRSLRWDLGDTKGTVAVRMPLHPIALELLKDTGPMAVSSANRSGAPAARTAAEAEEQLGASVAVYLDGGPCTDAIPSTIVDLTTPVPRVLRKGAITVEKLKGVVGYVATDE
ncbi:L-threonylcarbamoyladenylate synthase [Thermopolyspora sp. NPDC052614]|uniref:L-threonylcarbamoyladenylate synthase n=1 Tax=Thermopolyspora sp. NPDC052614 TaxID=3155682 RepID=UPI0034317059